MRSNLANDPGPSPGRSVALTTFTRIVILTAFYFVGGLLGKEASFLSGNVALVWPPSGIALAAILLFGYRFWPGVALGAILFSFTNGTPFGFFTFGTAIGNTIGAITCAFLLRKVIGFDNAMERTRDVTGYIAFACFLGTTVNAAFNVLGLAYARVVSWDNLFPMILQWWVPNALAALVVTPCIIAWASPSSIRWNLRLAVEAIICGVGLVVGTLLSFNTWIAYGIENYPLAYLPFPFLIWAALRFGQRGASTGTLLVSSLAIYALTIGSGPFVTATEKHSLMLIGSYIGILAVTNLLFAATAAERKRAQQETAESERRFRAVVEDQPDLICRFKQDGTLTFVNGAYCRFHEKEPAELIGTNFLDALSQEDAAIPLKYWDALSQGQEVLSFDHRIIAPDGRVAWQQYTVRHLGLNRGDAEFQAVIQDITGRKMAERALRMSKEKYQSLVANIPDAVWTMSANGEISYVSEKVEKILGYSVGEFISAGNEIWSLRIHPDDLPGVRHAFQKLFEENGKLDVEYRFCRKDGTWIWLHNRAPGARLQNGILWADGLFSDVTHRRCSEEALQHAKDAAEAANRTKSQFLANMSHELRTPLNAIIGFSEILAAKTFGELNERQVRYSNNIINSGHHLLQLINDILDLSKVEAGRLDLSPSSFELRKSFEEVRAIVRALAHKKNITVDFDASRDIPPLFADEPKFKQVLYNLLSNGIKFTPDGGRVVVKAELLPQSNVDPVLASTAWGDWLKIIVTDNGIGIPPQYHERIFVEFEQIDSSYGRKQQGTGLGLALTRRLVEMHGGRIWVESDGVEGSGSTFTILMPLQQQATGQPISSDLTPETQLLPAGNPNRP